MKKLSSEVISTNHINIARKTEMFQLYHNYYDATNFDQFSLDLASKNSVLFILEDSKIVGFTSIMHYIMQYDNKTIQVIYSGDTIMHSDYWSNPILSYAWLRFAGTLKNQNNNLPLYWFLIVKGHRTYRYLPVFSNQFYPNYKSATPAYEQKLLDHLATQTFGEHYIKSKGVVHFPQSKGHLKPSYATIPDKLMTRHDILFFIAKNPNYALGDELVCLCELSESNLKPLSRRLFKTGYSRTLCETL